MNPKFYVIPGRKVGPRVAAASFFAAKRGPCYQAANGDESGHPPAIATDRAKPMIEGIDRSP